MPFHAGSGGSGSGPASDVQITEGSVVATVFDLLNSNPQAVAIVDSNGDQVTSFGGGTEYTEAAAAAANPTGGMLMAVSISSPSSEVTSGQNVALRATPKGELYVSSIIDQNLITLSDSVSSGTVIPAGAFLMGFKSGTSQWARCRMEADNTDAIAVDTTGHLQILAHTLAFNGTSWDRVRGDISNGLDVDVTRVQGTVAVTQSGAWSTGRTWTLSSGTDSVAATVSGTVAISGTVAVTQSTSPWVVSNGGTFAVQATIAASATNIAKAEDAASADADVGVPAMAVRKATPANTSGTDGDYEMLQISAGRLWVSAVIDTALPAGTNAIGKLAANSGVTIGAVEIAAAQTLATVSTVTNLSQMGGAAIAMGTGTRSAGTQRVTIATDDVVPASQSGTWNIGTVTTVTTVSTVSAVSAITPGTGATNLGKAEDAAHTTGDVGVMALAVRNDTAAALATTTADYIPITTNSVGAVWVSTVPVATPTLSNVAASATSVTLLSANTSRKQLILVNDSSSICYVKFGTTASTTSYTVQMPAIANNQAAHLILNEDPIYTGRIDAIWASATGNMRITEITA